MHAEKRVCVVVRNDDCISIRNAGLETAYHFDHVARSSTRQAEMMSLVGQPAADKCLAGYNATIFAYGQTGSGKTYTMKGGVSKGLMPNIFEHLFREIGRRQSVENEFSVKVSCCEIYNKDILDLLDTNARRSLHIREDVKHKSFYVEHLSAKPCASADDCLKMLDLAASNRKTQSTLMNKESSRSHLVFSVLITRRKMLEVKDREAGDANHGQYVKSRTSRLNMVDLAGSERQRKSGAMADRLKEAKYINASLTELGRVISCIIKGEKHIPFRNSELTKLLKSSLGGSSLTFMIANVSPSVCNAAETLSTLQFADRAKQIRNNAKLNEELHPSLDSLKAENSKFVSQVEELTLKYQQSQQKNAELTEENCGLKTTVDHLKLQIEDLQVRLSATNSPAAPRDDEEEITFPSEMNQDQCGSRKSVAQDQLEMKEKLVLQENEIKRLQFKQLCTEQVRDAADHSLCSFECDPWIMISPKSHRKRMLKYKRTEIKEGQALSPITYKIGNEADKDGKMQISSNLHFLRLKDLSMDELMELLDDDIKSGINTKDWALLKQEVEERLLASPPIDCVRSQRKQFFENFGALVDAEWAEIKKEKPERFIEAIFKNNCIEKLSVEELLELMDGYKMQKTKLKRLEKERRQRMFSITRKRFGAGNEEMGLEDAQKGIKNYEVLLRVSNEEESERIRLVELAQSSDWKEISAQKIEETQKRTELQIGCIMTD